MLAIGGLTCQQLSFYATPPGLVLGFSRRKGCQVATAESGILPQS